MPLAPVENLDFRLNPDSNIPVYAQLASQLNCIIAAGQLNPGDLLPPIRKLAARLHLNPNTVARAYAELAQAGRLDKRLGCGCFVAPVQPRSSQEDRLQLLADRIEELVNDAHALGITTESLQLAVRQAGMNLTSAEVPGKPKPRRASAKTATVNPPVPAAKPDSAPAAAASLWPAAAWFVD
jgi:GntR family transcriptional regulator